MNLLWLFLAILFQISLSWITLFACKKKGSKKKNDKGAKTLPITKDENSSDSEEEKRGKKKGGKGKAKNAAKKGKKGKGKKTETEITEDPDLKSRDDYGIVTNDESLKHLKK
uniref:Uncharacterized protein n=1 Tax=Panagrolaimus superbus TaxID=310955 RepID=A0A914YRQ5_9BILA